MEIGFEDLILEYYKLGYTPSDAIAQYIVQLSGVGLLH